MATNGLTLWVLGGAGVTLMYAAYKGKSPLAVLTNHVAGTATPVAPPVSAAGSATPATTSAGVAESTPGVGATITQSGDRNNGPGYSVGTDSTGTQYVYDGNGNPVGTVPPQYSKNPATYIPPEAVVRGGGF